MTVSTTQSITSFITNGATTVFSIPFIMVAPEDIVVTYQDNSTTPATLTQLSPSQYTLFINPILPGNIWGIGGTVTYPTSGPPSPNGDIITVFRALPLTQTDPVGNQSNFYPVVVEEALDKLCFEIQQVASRTGFYRGVWVPSTQYNFGDIVQDGVNGLNTGGLYLCIKSNTSATWGTDLAAGDWVLILTSGLGTTPLPLSIGNGGTGATTVAGALANLGIGTAGLEDLSSVIIDNGAGALTIGNDQVTNAMLAEMAANTVKVNNTNASANPVDLPLTTNQILGRASGNIAGLNIGTGLSITGGDTLVATGGGGGGGGGVIVNTAVSQYTSTTVIPGIFTANTTPTITMGTEIINIAYTMKNITNSLRCRFVGQGSPPSSDPLIAALYKVGTTNCLQAASIQTSNNGPNQAEMIGLDHEFVPGTTSTINITIRAGSLSSGVTFNKGAQAGTLGGSIATTLILEEIDYTGGGSGGSGGYALAQFVTKLGYDGVTGQSHAGISVPTDGTLDKIYFYPSSSGSLAYTAHFTLNAAWSGFNEIPGADIVLNSPTNFSTPSQAVSAGDFIDVDWNNAGIQGIFVYHFSSSGGGGGGTNGNFDVLILDDSIVDNIFYIPSPVAGTLSAIKAVIYPVAGGAATTSYFFNVNGGATMAGGNIVIAGDPAGTVINSTPTTNNTVAVGDIIRVNRGDSNYGTRLMLMFTVT